MASGRPPLPVVLRGERGRPYANVGARQINFPEVSRSASARSYTYLVGMASLKACVQPLPPEDDAETESHALDLVETHGPPMTHHNYDERWLARARHISLSNIVLCGSWKSLVTFRNFS